MSYIKPNNDFFNHGDYKRVKDLFYSAYVISYKEDIFDKIFDSMKSDPYKKNKLKTVFIQLMKYLSRDHAFILGGGEPECCKYINSWLNMELTKPYYGLNETIFTIFEEFMKYFHINKDDKRCRNRIYLMEGKQVINMKNLYELYDKYTDLEEKYRTEHNKLPCTTYDSLIKDYNNFIINYRKQSVVYLNDFLNKFKNKIENFELISKNKCEKKVEILPPVEERPLPQEVDSAVHGVDLSQKNVVSTQQEEQPISQSHDGGLQIESKSVVSDLEHAPGYLREDKLEKTRDQLLTESRIETERSRHFGNTIGTEPGSNSDNPLGQNHSYLLMEEVGAQNPSRLPEVPSRDLLAEQGNKEGYYTSITDTISGFIRDVEPGPVLGVSGGMGVLFLLFKYTPVGSFFGGRRGRFRQIPRSFGGFAPGEFPNFQEYGGGYVGYNPMDINPLAE